MNYHYYINENDSLIFKHVKNYCCQEFELFTKGEDTPEYKIAHYKDNQWSFDDESRERLFWIMFNENREHFRKAFRNYFRSLEERPTVFECAIRRVNIKITKYKNKVSKSFYNIYPTR